MTVTDLYFTSGQAARQLGVSPATIRALCASGAMECQSTPGGQYRIAQATVERLKRDGLPEIPRPLPATRPAITRTAHGHPALLSDPSEEVIDSAEQVVVLENEVKSLGLRRQREEALDWFRARDGQQAEEQEAREREERAAIAEQKAQRKRERWLNRWLEYALGGVASEARSEVELEIHRQVRDVLDELGPEESDTVVRRLVDSLVAKVVRPWKRQAAIEHIIQAAVTRLPFEVRSYSEPTARQQQAAQAARRAVAELGSEADMPEVQAAARRAVDEVTAEHEHGKLVAEVASRTRLHLSGMATTEEREDAEQAVTAALAVLPVGTPKRELERARDAALVPVAEGILRRVTAEAQERQRREDQAAREAVADAGWRLPAGLPEVARQKVLAEIRTAIGALPEGTPRAQLERARDQVIDRCRRQQERQGKVARLVEDGLRHIGPYLAKLGEEWEFDKSAAELEAELREPVRAALEEELEGGESPEEVTRRARRVMRQRLNIC